MRTLRYLTDVRLCRFFEIKTQRDVTRETRYDDVVYVWFPPFKFIPHSPCFTVRMDLLNETRNDFGEAQTLW